MLPHLKEWEEGATVRPTLRLTRDQIRDLGRTRLNTPEMVGTNGMTKMVGMYGMRSIDMLALHAMTLTPMRSGNRISSTTCTTTWVDLHLRIERLGQMLVGHLSRANQPQRNRVVALVAVQHPTPATSAGRHHHPTRAGQGSKRSTLEGILGLRPLVSNGKRSTVSMIRISQQDRRTPCGFSR